MILDAQNQFEFGWGGPLIPLTVPGSGVSFKVSAGYDLNEDFGLGGGPAGSTGGFVRPGGPARKAGIPGMGNDEMLVHIRVTTSFVINAGFPLVQFHAWLSESAFPATGNFITIGSSMATRHVIGGRHHLGYRVEQLVAGNQFFIRLNPWTTPMGRDATFTQKEGKDLRYLGIAMTIPNFDVATTFFTAGTIEGRPVLSGDISQNPEEFIYPAARTVI